MLQELKTLIEEYLGSRKGRSRLTLAQETGVSYNTISRILLNDCSPSFGSVLKILRAIATEQKALDFIERHFPDFAELLNMRWPETPALPPQDGLGSENFAASLQARSRFEIICLCLRPQGTQEKEIISLFGEPGRRHLEVLLNLQLLSEKNGRFFSEHFRLESEEQVHAALRHVIDSLEERHLFLDKCHAYFQTAGLNEAGLKAVLGVLRNADIEIQRIRREAAFQGPFSAQIGTVLSQINPSTLSVSP